MDSSPIARYAPFIYAVAAVAWLVVAGLTLLKGRPLDAVAALAVTAGFGIQAVPAVRANRRLSVGLQVVGIVGLLAGAALTLTR